MQIKQTTAWAYNGHNYDTELEAVDKAISDIGKRIGREHASDVTQGMMLYREQLAPLLRRHIELAPADAAGTNSTEEADPESPEGTRKPWKGADTDGQLDREAAIARVTGEMQALGGKGGKQHVANWLTTRGYEDIRDFAARATDEDIESWRHSRDRVRPDARPADASAADVNGRD